MFDLMNDASTIPKRRRLADEIAGTGDNVAVTESAEPSTIGTAQDGSLTVFYLVMIFGNIVGMYLLNKVLVISETTLAIVSYLSSVGDYTIKAIAFQPWHLYIGTGVSMLRGISGAMCRAILSNKVPSNEIEKIYSLTTSMESISPLASAPLYSLVYANTLNTFPGAFNLISAGIYLMCVVLTMYSYLRICCGRLVFMFLKRNPQVTYVPVDE